MLDAPADSYSAKETLEIDRERANDEVQRR